MVPHILGHLHGIRVDRLVPGHPGRNARVPAPYRYVLRTGSLEERTIDERSLDQLAKRLLAVPPNGARYLSGAWIPSWEAAC